MCDLIEIGNELYTVDQLQAQLTEVKASEERLATVLKTFVNDLVVFGLVMKETITQAEAALAARPNHPPNAD